jgi:hypothetical protein
MRKELLIIRTNNSYSCQQKKYPALSGEDIIDQLPFEYTEIPSVEPNTISPPTVSLLILAQVIIDSYVFGNATQWESAHKLFLTPDNRMSESYFSLA